MSYHLCSKCGHREELFGHAGARNTAAEMGVEFLGEIPLHTTIRQLGDAGRPACVEAPEAAHVQPFFAIAKRVLEKLAATTHDQGPSITVE